MHGLGSRHLTEFRIMQPHHAFQQRGSMLIFRITHHVREPFVRHQRSHKAFINHVRHAHA